MLDILKHCPGHGEGIHFAFLADIQPDPYYGMRVLYDDCEGPRGLYVAALVAGTMRSKTEQVSDDGYNVVTRDVKDIANPAGDLDTPVGNHTLVGYCSMADLLGFRLGPPRGNNFRAALVLFTKADEHEHLHIHKLEYIEQDELENAVDCMRKLRRLCKGVQSASTEKRSRNIDLACLSSEGSSPLKTKNSRTLQAAPTDASLP